MQPNLDLDWHEAAALDWGGAAWRSQTLVIRARIAAIKPAAELLSADERTRLETLKSVAKRQEFLATRTLVRQTLGRALDRDPRALEFAYGPLGKPELVSGRWHFNLSHSGDLVLLALGPDPDLGVDLEIEQPDRDWLRLAKRFFSSLELAELTRMSPEARLSAGYEIWTRKEAVLKAVGSGVFERLAEFSVASGAAPQILESWAGSPQLDKFEIISIAVPGARAALCRRRSARGIYLSDHDSWRGGETAQSR